eukprot:745848_1
MSLQQVFTALGFTNSSKMIDTLQGSVWKASNTNTTSNNDVVIKVTNRSLHSKSAAVVKGHTYNVHENILSETEIQQYLTNTTDATKCPNSIVKYVDSFQSDDNFFLIQEYGGGNLLDFTLKIHKYISTG